MRPSASLRDVVAASARCSAVERAGPVHLELAHVRDVEEPDALAHGAVLLEDARVLDRHLPAAEVDQLRAELAMEVDRAACGAARRAAAGAAIGMGKLAQRGTGAGSRGRRASEAAPAPVESATSEAFPMDADRPAGRARRARRARLRGAGLIAEADMLYRLAETLEAQDRAAAAASLARVLIASGRADQARPLRPRRRRPGPRRAAPARGPRASRGAAAPGRGARGAIRSIRASPRRGAVWRFSRSASTRPSAISSKRPSCEPDGLPDATDRRFLRAARALAPDQIPAWKDAVAAARDRLAAEAARRCARASPWPDRSAELLRSLIRRGVAASEGVLERARRLAELPALAGRRRARALLGRRRRASCGGSRRGSVPLPDGRRGGGDLARRPGRARARARRRRSASSRWARRTPGDFVGEEALARRRRATSDARAPGPATLLGFTPDFFAAEPDRAAWLRLPARCGWRAGSAA